MTFLTKEDLPIVARAIVACIRNLARIDRVRFKTTDLVKLKGVGFDIYVRSEDWLKIAPYLVDGTFNPMVEAVVQVTADQPLDVSLIDIQDRDLYRRVYGILTYLFQTAFPTSKL